MKKGIVLLLGMGIIYVISQSFITEYGAAVKTPEKVKALLDSSCYDCHSSKSKKMSARINYNLDKWEGYRATKKIGFLEKINEVVTEEKMPPKKYLKKHPEKELSEAQKEMISDWTISESRSLMEGN